MNLFKKILLGVGSLLGLIDTGNAATVQPTTARAQRSALSSTKDNASKIAEAIKAACGGNVTSANIGSAIKDVVASTGASINDVASALSTLGLGVEENKSATAALSETFNVSHDSATSALVTEIALNNGEEAGKRMAAELGDKQALEKELTQESRAFGENTKSVDSSGFSDDALHVS